MLINQTLTSFDDGSLIASISNKSSARKTNRYDTVITKNKVDELSINQSSDLGYVSDASLRLAKNIERIKNTLKKNNQCINVKMDVEAPKSKYMHHIINFKKKKGLFAKDNLQKFNEKMKIFNIVGTFINTGDEFQKSSHRSKMDQIVDQQKIIDDRKKFKDFKQSSKPVSIDMTTNRSTHDGKNIHHSCQVHKKFVLKRVDSDLLNHNINKSQNTFAITAISSCKSKAKLINMIGSPMLKETNMNMMIPNNSELIVNENLKNLISDRRKENYNNIQDKQLMDGESKGDSIVVKLGATSNSEDHSETFEVGGDEKSTKKLNFESFEQVQKCQNAVDFHDLNIKSEDEHEFSTNNIENFLMKSKKLVNDVSEHFRAKYKKIGNSYYGDKKNNIFMTGSALPSKRFLSPSTDDLLISDNKENIHNPNIENKGLNSKLNNHSTKYQPLNDKILSLGNYLESTISSELNLSKPTTPGTILFDQGPSSNIYMKIDDDNLNFGKTKNIHEQNNNSKSKININDDNLNNTIKLKNSHYSPKNNVQSSKSKRDRNISQLKNNFTDKLMNNKKVYRIKSSLITMKKSNSHIIRESLNNFHQHQDNSVEYYSQRLESLLSNVVISNNNNNIIENNDMNNNNINQYAIMDKIRNNTGSELFFKNEVKPLDKYVKSKNISRESSKRDIMNINQKLYKTMKVINMKKENDIAIKNNDYEFDQTKKMDKKSNGI